MFSVNAQLEQNLPANKFEASWQSCDPQDLLKGGRSHDTILSLLTSLINTMELTPEAALDVQAARFSPPHFTGKVVLLG